ncbi:DNA polymerase III subunit alpha [bacterium]|jgi:DNA polymerase III subunit alpha|nr:DNA polymerase III subunit alpha [bacterium]
MADRHFTHLHLHSEYSLLDGAIKLDRLIEFGLQQKLKALAITDHGNIFGAVKFFQKCKKAGIRPVLGIESYLTEDVKQKTKTKRYHHAILLVKNKIGYQNLCKLISFSFQKGFYFKPRIDYNILEKHSEGLIATTACLGSHTNQLLMEGKEKEARKWIDWYLRVFGPENFYFEVQPEDQEEQVPINKKLFELGKELGVRCVATADCHYLTMEDHEAHEVMLSIQTRAKMTDPDRFSFGDVRAYARTTEEMLDEFKDHPEAIWNTGYFADKCEFDFETGKLFFPKFEIPKDFKDDENYFVHLCKQGLKKLFDNKRINIEQKEKYEERLQIEMDLIIKMGFIGYFLIVGDFIQWAKKNKIPVGPGRGSAAGSLVSWALEITDIDPLKYNLLFERFLNPERISMPDIDIDFCIEKRENVIEYVKEKYGHDNVCQIITFGTMLAKGVIKDVARALGIPFEDSNAITNLIPDQLKITLKEAIEQEPRLQELIDSNPQVSKLFDLAFNLEGLTRHASKHAAGIVITPQPVDEVLPLYIPSKTTELVAQYAMTELESIGFLKMDFLGLKNLTLIDKTVKLVKKNHAIELDMDHLPLDDPKAFELICAGKTSGVFQLESDGLKEVLRKLQPEKFEDIIAVNALYRPGPLGSGMVDDFIERRHGRAKISYLFKELAPILEETYGVIVYQEQVMKIASTVGGYSLGESDILRRAMGKKKVDVMAEQRKLFLERAKGKGFDSKKSAELFDLMAYFAGYGFNKSHSAAYAMIAYQTAYLKANFLPEFMACLISLEATNADKMSFYLEEAKEMGLDILPPNINKSQIDFTVVNNKILFGLRGTKSVGLTALENIIAEQQKEPFKDLMDFCKRVELRTCNKRVIENLVCAGAFDTLPGNRAQKHEAVSKVLELAALYKKAKETGQMGLFGIGAESDENSSDLYSFQPLTDWNTKEKLEKEKEVIGFYLSSHPLDTYKEQTRCFSIPSFSTTLEKNQNAKQEPIVTGFGLIKSQRIINTKKGDRMAFVQLEDKTSKAELIVFPRVFKKVEQWLSDYNVFVVKGAFDLASTTMCKIKVNEMVPIELFFQEWQAIQSAKITIPTSFDKESFKQLKQQLPKGKIPLTIAFNENGKNLTLHTKTRVSCNLDVCNALEKKDICITLEI